MNKPFDLYKLTSISLCRQVAIHASLSVVLASCFPLLAVSQTIPSVAPEAAASDANLLASAFRNAANGASPGLVTVYSMRGPRMTAAWRMREAHLHGRLAAATGAAFESHSLTDEQGSGLVIDQSGLILTCHHVVAAADVIVVVLPDGRRCEPVEVHGDPVTDIAILRIEGAGDLAEVKLGDSTDLQVGDWVVTLANPFELDRSVSLGVISATNRRVPGMRHPLIQYDASTNPGSSGGAVLNLQGEVIGIITGSFGQSDRFQGIGIAVPSSVAKDAIQRIQEPRRFEQTALGCQTKAISPSVAKMLELPVSGGLYVEAVEAASPAEKAGIQEGDIITRFAGRPVGADFAIDEVLAIPTTSATTTFALYREGETVEVSVKFATPLPRNLPQKRPEDYLPRPDPQHRDEALGLGIDELNDRVTEELGFQAPTSGVLVTDVHIAGKAYKEGIAAGMIIKRVNDQPITDLASYRAATTQHSPDKPLLMLVRTNEGNHLVVFEE